MVGKVSLQDTSSCRTPPRTVAETASDASGHWVIRHPDPSTYRVVAESEGYVPRVILGLILFDDEPQWKFLDSALAKPITLSGRITDGSGKPLQGAGVSIQEVTLASGEIYEPPIGFTPMADEDGRFSEEVPAGKATLWPYLSGWCGPSLKVSIPQTGISLRMIRTADVRVTVDFTGTTQPQLYRVSIEPDGDKVEGMHDQWAHITDCQLTFHDVYPGRYLIRGQPEDGEKTAPLKVELVSGKKAEVTLRAK
jgi:hypothetical protein